MTGCVGAEQTCAWPVAADAGALGARRGIDTEGRWATPRPGTESSVNKTACEPFLVGTESSARSLRSRSAQCIAEGSGGLSFARGCESALETANRAWLSAKQPDRLCFEALDGWRKLPRNPFSTWIDSFLCVIGIQESLQPRALAVYRCRRSDATGSLPRPSNASRFAARYSGDRLDGIGPA